MSELFHYFINKLRSERLRRAVDANFELAPSSRLPKWVAISGYPREALSMEIISHTSGKVVMRVYVLSPKRVKLMEKVGKARRHPITEKTGYGVFPNYTIISVEGYEDEVFEHRVADHYYFITDDPKITAGIHKGINKRD